MSNSVIRAELETRLKAWADAQNPAVPIAFQGVAFTKPTTGPYMEAYLIPGPTLNKELSGARKTYIGLFQVNCCVPSGKGAGPAEALAASVVDLFPMLPKTGLVSIDQTPSAERPIPDNAGWLIVPVTIKYRMEAF